MNKTPNYQLNQWEVEDRVLRTDFNADNAKIDAALGALSGRAQIAVGHYAGDNAATRFISTGFTPRAVLVVHEKGYTYSTGMNGSAPFGGLAVTGYPVGYSSSPAIQIVSGGFNVFTASHIATNQKNDNYNYIALA